MVKTPIDKNGVDNATKKCKEKENSNGISGGPSRTNTTGTKQRATPSSAGAPKSVVNDDKKLRAEVSQLTKNLDKLVQEVGKLKAQPAPPPPPAPFPPDGDYFPPAHYYMDEPPYGYHAAEEYYDDGYDVPYVDPEVESSAGGGSASCVDVNNENEHVDEQTGKETDDDIVSKFDKFLDELNVKDTEEHGADVEAGLAKGVNRMFAKGMETAHFKQMAEKIKRPGNCNAITPVKVDTIVWNLLKQPTKKFDERLQVVQTALVKSACNLTQVVDKLQTELSEHNAPSREQIEQLTSLSINSLALMGHGYHSLCLRRRELQKPEVAWKYANLFSPELEHNQWLYGGNDKVEKLIKDIGTSNQVSSRLRLGSVGRGARRGQDWYHQAHYGQRGSSFGPMRRGYPRSRHYYDYGPYPTNTRGHGGRGMRGRGGLRGRGSSTSASKGEVSFKLSHKDVNETVHNVTASLNEPFQAGRLKYFIGQWQELTSDEEILQTVRGCTIEFYDLPSVQTSKPISKFNASQSVIVQNEIEKLLEKQVLEIVESEPDENISSIFLRRKRNGTYRMILNLKPFNKNVEYFHFKMDTFDMAIKLLFENCYMASLDLKDAYYSVPIHVDFRKYLRFIWNGKTFQYNALPNGLSCGPRKFTKLMKPVYATLRKLGINVSGFLDDLLIVGHSAHELEAHVQTVVHTLQNLGFVINFEKSNLKPCTRLRHLGFMIDSVTMAVSLPQDKVDIVKELCADLSEKSEDTIRNVAKVIGNIVACFPAVQVGQLHYRNIELAKDEALRHNKGNFDAVMQITEMMQEDLNWWVENIELQNKPILERSPEISINSDASTEGWGGTCNDDRTGGRWNEEEQTNHINFLELLGIFFVLKSFQHELVGKRVHCLSDSTTAIAYINHMGGKIVQLNNLAREIWNWALNKGIWLTAGHVRGVDNDEADYESRHFNDRSEWSLDNRVFDKLQNVFGEHDIDLFASRLNAKCEKYVSWQRDPKAEFVDAFSQSWTHYCSYIFPPFSLIGRVLQKLKTEGGTATVIVPYWPTQPWFTTFVDMLIDHPMALIMLPKYDKLLVLEHNVQELHPLRKKLRLLAGRLSGQPTKKPSCQNVQPVSCYMHGNQGPINNILCISESGTSFVSRGKPIVLHQMFL